MNFYAVLFFLGILLIVISLFWVILDKKKAFGFASKLEDKKQELVEIINDAEQMIEELNRFSDYIVTQMDLKNEELRVNLRNADEEIKAIGQKAQTVRKAKAVSSAEEEPKVIYKQAAVVNGSKAESAAAPAEIMFKQHGKPGVECMEFDNPVARPSYHPPKQAAKKTEKVIPINSRYGDVLRLSESGLSELDIARMLNMGKGEVELILGINKN